MKSLTIFNTGAVIALSYLAFIHNKKINKMATTEERFKAALTQIDNVTNEMAAELRSLKDQISANNAGMTKEAEEGLLNQVESIAQRLTLIGTSPDNPVPTPNETGEPADNPNEAEQPIGDLPGQQAPNPDEANGTIPSTDNYPSTMPGDDVISLTPDDTLVNGEPVTPAVGDNADANAGNSDTSVAEGETTTNLTASESTPVSKVAASFPKATAKATTGKKK